MSAREDAAERAFRALLRAYPPDFRAGYAREMVQLFRDRRRVGHEAGMRFWMEIVLDAARSAPALRIERLRATGRRGNQLTEGTMRPIAILAVLVGVVQVANAMLEWSAGRSQSGDGYSVAGVALGLVAAALLVGAGIAMLRRGRDAAALARVAAVGCLVMVVLIRFVQPWMSIFGLLLGIGFPIALLVFLFLTRSSGPASRMTA
ncbi:MAG TPA: hypothetical protein VGP25_21080 [Gemmatimonadaceae bacterium]|jgi:uncharacterized membrane protein YhaH (DUF805 family)|nr:hypothetical protein [Gemmatimonadaceae bacterium]